MLIFDLYNYMLNKAVIPLACLHNCLTLYVCMYVYLGPFSIKGIQYTQCDMILNMWTKVEILRLLLSQ